MNRTQLFTPDFDIVVVGAGFCGSAVAIKAADLGLRVRVFDGLAEYSDLFRAEKLEPDQYGGLEELEMINLVRPVNSMPIEEVHEITGDKRTVVKCQKHRGMDYAATVNSFRSVLQDRGHLESRKVSKIEDLADHSIIHVDDGTLIRSRLAVVATGLSAGLRKSLNLRTHEPNALLSTTFGFDVEPESAAGFPFHAFNFRPEKFIAGLQFATFFPIGDRTRVNVFTCWHPGNEEARQFRSNPLAQMHKLFPTLRKQVGDFKLSSPLQVYTTNYFRQRCDHLLRTIVVGDAYQSVSPATGIGLSKCITDVIVLMQVLRKARQANFEDLDLPAFYSDPVKREVDDAARNRWEWVNELATSRTSRTGMKKMKKKLRQSGIAGMIGRRRKSAS